MDKPTLNININKDDENLNDFLYCWSTFVSRPNKITIYNTYSTKIFNDILSKIVIERNVFTEFIPSDDDFIINDKMFVKIDDDLYISYVVLDRSQDNSVINEITFLYKDYDTGFKKVQEIIESLNSCIVDFCDEEGNNLNTISLSPNGIDMEPIDGSILDADNIKLYYDNKTFKSVDKLIKNINKSNKGLSILYGERGCGKTSMINYIASKLDRIVIFIPNNLIESTINNPEFRRFLRKHYKPVIVIDDCEMFFNEVFTKSNMFVNNLLQMIDGFLSDSIELNVISLFNVIEHDEIDHSLIECNNLIDIIEFNPLSIDDANGLSKHLKHNKSYKCKTKLVDVIKNRKIKGETNIGF